MTEELSITIQIEDLFEINKLKDLKRFIKSRNNYNKCNNVLIYFFYIIQTGGILTTTIATGYNNKPYIWLGVALNCLASLIHVFEKTNSEISSKLFKDIKKIKENNYIGESDITPNISGSNNNNNDNNDNNDNNNNNNDNDNNINNDNSP